MKFKKILLVLLSILLCCFVFTACEDGEKKANKPSLQQGEMAVHFFDVGQGDSEFIEFPNGKTMLIDAGESEMGERVVSNIKALGYDEITYVVATHPHSDHIGGLVTVLNSFNVDTVYMPSVSANTSTFEKLIYILENKKCKVVEAKSGVVVIDEDNLFAQFVAPVSDKYDNLNDYSAVLKLKHGNNSFLFTGDAEKTSENEITADIKADVLKVGHHGSNTSSTKKFVEKVNPKYAVFEVGKDNSYNHPSSEIVKRYEKIGAEILRTDKNGNITIKSDGNELTVFKNFDFTTLNGSSTNQSQKNNSTELNTITTQINDNNSTLEDKTNYKWVLNTKSKKIHTPSCSSVEKIASSNCEKSNKSLAELEKDGYSICKSCNPSE